MRSAHRPSSSIERILVLVLIGLIAIDLLLVIPAYASELRLDRLHPSLPIVNLRPLAASRARIADGLGEDFTGSVQRIAGELEQAGAKALNVVLSNQKPAEPGSQRNDRAIAVGPSPAATQTSNKDPSLIPSYTPTSTAALSQQDPSMTPSQATVLTATVICATVSTTGCQSTASPTSTPTGIPTSAPVPTSTRTSIPVPTSASGVPAFPGAEGWGAESIGGRGGRVIEVINLNDSGPGSFRAAVQAHGPRIVVFRVAGVITLSSSISVNNPYLTIAGQTAPGTGITLRGRGLNIHTHNVIIRYVSYRGTGDDKDNYFFILRPDSDGTHDIIVDHCSGSWADDDLISINHNSDTITQRIYNVTVQNCLFGYPNPNHPTTMLIANNSGFGRTHRVSIHDNLFSTSGHRNPNAQGVEHVEVINNVVYNFRHRVGDFTVDLAEEAGSEVDYINNYLYRGPASGGRFIRWDDRPDAQNNVNDPTASVYVAGNIAPVAGGLLSSPLTDPNADNWVLITNQGSNAALSTVHQRNTRLSQPVHPVSVEPATTAYQQVLEAAGDYRRLNEDGSWTIRRDKIDLRLISEVQDDTGPSDYFDVDVPGDIGLIEPGSSYDDSDHDGMADAWEELYCLDPNDPLDGPGDADGDGYTNIEEFLNGTLPTAGGAC